MATINLEIGPADEQRVLLGFKAAYGVPPGEDPETWLPTWTQVGLHVADFIENVTLGVEANDAANTARADALTNSVDIDVSSPDGSPQVKVR